MTSALTTPLFHESIAPRWHQKPTRFTRLTPWSRK
jgi:hypothetical protein